MPVSDHLFIHPWFHTDEHWAGFHIKFTGHTENFAEALSRLIKHPALASLNHRLPWFIPVYDIESIASIRSLREKHVVFLVNSSAANRESLEAELHHAKEKLGLVLAPCDPLPVDHDWRYVVLTASHARTLPASTLRELAAKATIAVTGLRTRSELAWATAHHCSLVTGEYMLSRSSPCNKPDMLRVRLLKLLALIAADADTCEIEEVFRQEPKLAYGLLRLVNSAAMAPRSPISSFVQAITILGRQQLQRWLQLLVYADANDGQHPNPLLLQAATRGRLMELLSPHIEQSPDLENPSDAAFMIGTFSLLDVLLNLSMPEILQQLPLPKTVRGALEEYKGPLGSLLIALSAADNGETETASRLLDTLGITSDAFTEAQLNALEWANHIRIPHV